MRLRSWIYTGNVTFCKDLLLRAFHIETYMRESLTSEFQEQVVTGLLVMPETEGLDCDKECG